jgi:putative endonuclease
MKWVYLIQSISNPDRIYVGLTRNLDYRIKAHNQGQSPHTSKYRPWEVLVALTFTDDQKAEKFERYLKSGSGQAFLNRHFR